MADVRKDEKEITISNIRFANGNLTTFAAFPPVLPIRAPYTCKATGSIVDSCAYDETLAQIKVVLKDASTDGKVLVTFAFGI